MSRSFARAPSSPLSSWPDSGPGPGPGPSTGDAGSVIRVDLGYGRIRLQTLSITRWVAVTGQLFTILFVHFSLSIPLPLAWLLPAVALTAAINLVLHVHFRRPATVRLPERAILPLFLYDVLQLTWLLELTGGLNNPFALLIILPLALGAATLGRDATIALTATALACTALLGLVPTALPWFDQPISLPQPYLLALWVALSLTIILVAGYTWQIAQDARQHGEALNATQLALAREQQLSALGGQAAAVAHLLGTPLATINIIAKELNRELPEDSPLKEDVDELLAQAHRCREALATLGRGDATEVHGGFTAAPLSSLLDEIASQHARPGVEARVETVLLDDAATEPRVSFRPEIRHALANLVDNAIRCAEREVVLTLEVDAHEVAIVIEDDGPGIPPEVLDRIGEPYVSTRHEADGLGLGIFIANTLLARTGAKLHFGNTSSGARVQVRWPAAALDHEGEETQHDRRHG